MLYNRDLSQFWKRTPRTVSKPPGGRDTLLPRKVIITCVIFGVHSMYQSVMRQIVWQFRRSRTFGVPECLLPQMRTVPGYQYGNSSLRFKPVGKKEIGLATARSIRMEKHPSTSLLRGTKYLSTASFAAVGYPSWILYGSKDSGRSYWETKSLQRTPPLLPNQQ